MGTNVNVLSSTTLTVTTPAGTGNVDVRISTPAGTSPPVAADRFTYSPPAFRNVLATGGFFGLAATKDGSVWAWGRNDYGQLGNGTQTLSKTPIQVPGFTGATSVAAGYYHSLVLKADGTVWAWGKGGYGQLGNGTFSGYSTSPVQVSGITGASGVAAGAFHSVAVMSNGSVETWGYNNSGQLGNGTTTNSNTPVQVTGLNNVTMVAAGAYHSLALKADGTVWSWGANDAGQLGNGTTSASLTPVQVMNLSNVTALAAGTGSSSYALRSDGTMWAWGENGFGQLGNTSAGRKATQPVQVAISNVTSIGAGSTWAFAIKADGTAWSWGDNNYGQLGSTACTSKTCSVPVQVSNLSNVVYVTSGSGAFSLAARADGTAWAWGQNTWGQLGNGTMTPSPTPVQVSNLNPV
jgi:alpha-tubulin suppressor-like RCC1 family protein